jgi:hypothetical protein
MTAAQRFLVLVHAALVAGFFGYTLALASLVLQQAQTGYLSEGAKIGAVIGGVTLGCGLLSAGGVLLWARTGQRRFALVADAIVIATSWTGLLVLMAFEPALYIAFLSLTVLCVLVAALVPGPRRSHDE